MSGPLRRLDVLAHIVLELSLRVGVRGGGSLPDGLSSLASHLASWRLAWFLSLV